MLLYFRNSKTKEMTIMSKVLSKKGAGVGSGYSIPRQVNHLVACARDDSVEVIRIAPSGKVFLDGEMLNDQDDLDHFLPADVMKVFAELYRLGGMSPKDEPPYVGECQWPAESPVTKIKIACVPINPSMVEMVLRFVDL